MAPPFTRITSFTTGTPITHEFLNALQDGLTSAAFPSYGRLAFFAWTDVGVVVNFNLQPYMIKDAATGKYVGMPAVNGAQIFSGFGTNSWLWCYVQVNNGIPSYSCSTTAPEASLRFMSGDETRRYICPIWCDGSGAVRTFHAFGGPSGTSYHYHRKVLVVGGDSAPVFPNSTSWQTVTLSGATSLPSTANIIRVRLTGESGVGAIHHVYIRGNTAGTDQSATGSLSLMLGPSNPATPAWSVNAELFEVFASGSFSWSLSVASPNIGVRALVDGFRE